MYVEWTQGSQGTLRVLTIDPATGLPIDQSTDLPQLGTTNPVESRFASGFTGPWGLEFDPLTNNLFVSTFSQALVIQIGGLGTMAPERKSEIARLAMRAMCAGALATCITACVAGLLGNPEAMQ